MPRPQSSGLTSHHQDETWKRHHRLGRRQPNRAMTDQPRSDAINSEPEGWLTSRVVEQLRGSAIRWRGRGPIHAQGRGLSGVLLTQQPKLGPNTPFFLMEGGPCVGRGSSLSRPQRLHGSARPFQAGQDQPTRTIIPHTNLQRTGPGKNDPLQRPEVGHLHARDSDEHLIESPAVNLDATPLQPECVAHEFLGDEEFDLVELSL